MQYWSFTYPRCEGNQTPPCSQDAVWGAPTDPGDDLYLYFDVWAKGTDRSTDPDTTKVADATQKMTMRNEISANANKIEPNPDGDWFNTDTNIVYPGDVITTNGVNYTFGNVNKGFDNDGDGNYDNNAWMQPFGAPSYDPSCFRLVRTTGTLTVTRSGGNPPMILNFKDQLYFTNLPDDNTNVTGRVYYTFLALGGVCTTSMTPYQEAASGADNGKLNGDYGTGIPPLQSFSSLVTVDKTGNASVVEDTTITYNIPFTNTGDTNVGLTMTSGIPVEMPFTLQDTVPDGLSYVCGSASASLAFTPDPDTDDYTLLYSKDSGLTWSTSETALWSECATPGTTTTQPSAGSSSRIILQWRLNAPLPRRPASGPNTSTGTATFQAHVPGNFVNSGGNPFIENTACANFGGATTNLDCGDLPNPYNYRTTIDREGPCHVSQTLADPDHYLGATWDGHLTVRGRRDRQPVMTTPARTTRTLEIVPIDFALWEQNTSQSIRFTVVGNNAYLAGWFDWNDDFDFVTPTGDYDPGEYVCTSA